MTTIRRKYHRRSPLAKKKRKALLFKIGAVAFIIIAFFAGAVYISGFEKFNISNISVKGNQSITEKSIREFVEKKISGKKIFLFPKSNILLYPRSAVGAALLEEYKGIKEVNIEVEDLESITVNIEERKPFALWCGENYKVIVEDEDKCYFLDESGFIFTEAPHFSGNVFFRYFGWDSDKVLGKNPVGMKFISTEKFQKINFFLSSMRDIEITPISLSMIDDTDYEMLLETGGKILFGQNQNLSFVFDNIQSVFDSEEFNEYNLSVLDYADFRFGNKVYFKFK
ncbi:MAG: hypothetical protein QGG63_00280 [Candidatus Pacebacteria bacterium]|jgi:hypothetical protein|nr:hypothetical protein [Candidatus Paceibacterota bacterium]|tara:strand:+ start:35624 stop:36472 length:849 start_codon:yes stop_codon:yes gene_type:complete